MFEENVNLPDGEVRLLLWGSEDRLTTAHSVLKPAPTEEGKNKR